MSRFLDELDLKELNEYQKNKRNWLLETNYSEKSTRTYWRMLNANVLFRENSRKKDLYDFTKSEVIEIIKTMPTINEKLKYSMYSIINSYMMWACKRGLNYVGNPCDTIVASKIIDINIEAIKKSYMTLDEFYKFLDTSLICSDVDKMILVLLRYGIRLQDIPALKNTDVDRNEMEIYVSRKNKVLIYPIDDRFLERFDKCIACDRFKYLQEKSEGKKALNINTVYSETGYIIKSTGRSNGAIVNTNSLYGRVDILSRNSGISRVKAGNLNKARKYDFLFRTYKNFGEVDMDDVRNVIEVFDGEHTPSNTQTLKNEFQLISDIDVKTINYGVEKIHGIKRERKDIFSQV